MGIVALVFAVWNRSSGKDVGTMLICGLCLQGLIVWSAASCFCYDAFTGDMSLHRAAEFQFGTFLTACFGVFPATLLALLAPITAVALSGAWKRTGGAGTDSQGSPISTTEDPTGSRSWKAANRALKTR